MLLPVLFEDTHLRIINKPEGFYVTPPREGSPAISTETGLYVCHRLDADTSGCLILAKTMTGLRAINAAFAENRIQKTYIAIVAGHPPAKGHCTLPIGTWRRGRVSTGQGRPAETFFENWWQATDRTALKVQPRTGRTHQIRAHLGALGHPLIGDPLYGGPASTRLWLHAYQLDFSWPQGHALHIEAPLPAGFDAPK